MTNIVDFEHKDHIATNPQNHKEKRQPMFVGR